jgi:hypothetical protein
LVARYYWGVLSIDSILVHLSENSKYPKALILRNFENSYKSILIIIQELISLNQREELKLKKLNQKEF